MKKYRCRSLSSSAALLFPQTSSSLNSMGLTAESTQQAGLVCIAAPEPAQRRSDDGNAPSKKRALRHASVGSLRIKNADLRPSPLRLQLSLLLLPSAKCPGKPSPRLPPYRARRRRLHCCPLGKPNSVGPKSTECPSSRCHRWCCTRCRNSG